MLPIANVDTATKATTATAFVSLFLVWLGAVFFFCWWIFIYRSWKLHFFPRSNSWSKKLYPFSLRPAGNRREVVERIMRSWKIHRPARVVQRPQQQTTTGEEPYRMDMDVCHLSLLQYSWGILFVAVPAMMSVLFCLVKFKLREALNKMGWISIEEVDIAAVVAGLMLETSLVLNFDRKTEDGRRASFCILSFPTVEGSGSVEIHDCFVIEIDLHTKRMLSAQLGGVELTAQRALIIVWWYIISVNHIKLHAFAERGMDTAAQDGTLRRNSVVSIMYNFFGRTAFPYFWLPLAQGTGILSTTKGNFTSECIREVFAIGIEGGVWDHSAFKELTSHSRYVRFSLLLRPIFLNKLKNYELGSASILRDGGEAFFVGTVLHGLDHAMGERVLADPLWLNVDDPVFGMLAALGRVARAGFVEDISGLYFAKRFRSSRHPFYAAVYQKAKLIDPFMADLMDTCIVK